MSKTPVIIHWFRRDLRLYDNHALAEALRRARESGGRAAVLPLFIFDSEILKKLEDQDDPRVGFIHQTLAEMRKTLREFGADILCLTGKPVEIWEKVITAQFEVVGVVANEDYEPYAVLRDGQVSQLLSAKGIPFDRFKDQVVFAKSDVVKDDGKPYTVFTPYSKKWLNTLEERRRDRTNPLDAYTCDLSQGSWLKIQTEFPTLEQIGFKKNADIEIPSAKISRETLTKYASQRDLPRLPGTSRLGLHLRFGTVSIRELAREALRLKSDVWLKELIWREFFMQILWHFPHVAKGAFRPEYDQIKWRNNQGDFKAWCEGRTGYPLVDAGMRELNATGFMHNRVRMVAGSFLVKHLLIDWRWGERYFARRLLDFDLAANNGNWQWVAGSGCDAAPYFRVFNPELQLKKFDPTHEYVRKWVPEFGTADYAMPIVNHAEAREQALRAYAVVKQK